MMRVELRDYQAEAFESARDAVRRGKKRILIVAPTGSGKTVLASALMEMVSQKGNRAAFVVDRLSLVQQTSDTFDRYGLHHGVIQGGHERFHPDLALQVCSIQTLSRRRWPDTHVDIFDEAHVLHKAHKKRMESNTALTIGLTATPFTKGLAQWFDEIINVTTTRDLITQGFLSPYRIFSCAEPDMTGVTVKSTGEWDETEASSKALQVVGDVVAEYQKHGEHRKFICSGVDTTHVMELQRQFLAAGINVATYTYKDKEEDRADVTTEFRKPDSAIRGLITVTAASRGFDVPDVSCVIMARPLRRSLAEHIQLFGRGLRISEGKKDCVVLDHSGNCARFFEECEAFFETGVEELDTGKEKTKDKKQETKEGAAKCPRCRALHKPMPVCPCCGFEYPKKKSVEHVPGTLTELIASGNQRQLTKDLWPQIAGYCLERKQGDDARRQALAIYKNLVGAWPRAEWENTIPIPPSPEVRGRIRADQIRYSFRRSV